MYPQHANMAPQKPETFMLSTEAQQALPHDAQVALQQVDNRKCYRAPVTPVVHPTDTYPFGSEIFLNLCACRLAA